MCEHIISRHLKLAFVEHIHGKATADQIGASYDQHAAAVYGVLLRVVECELCAGEILVNTFLTTCCRVQPTPRLHQLVTAALACSCRSIEEKNRHNMNQRIADWYRTVKEHLPTASQMAPTGEGLYSSQSTLMATIPTERDPPDIHRKDRGENRNAREIESGAMMNSVKEASKFGS